MADEKRKTLSNRPPLVLAVDDSAVQLQFVQSLLERHGYTVKTARSGEDALQMLHEVIPAVLILDVMMTGMSGYDVCRQLKQDEGLRSVPVVFLTARSSPQDFKVGLDAGGVFYLAKPIKGERLLNAVRMLCPLPQTLPS